MDNDIFNGFFGNIFIDSPNKYGKDTYSDISELADSLAGRNPSEHRNPVADPQPQRTQDVDESFWDAIRDQSRKYGAID